MCEHINGSYPAAEGTLERWQQMLQKIKPMRFMWWWNPVYVSKIVIHFSICSLSVSLALKFSLLQWSTQGPIWRQAAADPKSDIGRW